MSKRIKTVRDVNEACNVGGGIVNRLCGSGLDAIGVAAQSILPCIMYYVHWCWAGHRNDALPHIERAV